MPGKTTDSVGGGSRLTSVSTIVTIVVSVCSLLFAGWQYVERRGADAELADLQVKAERYKAMILKAKNAARLDESYVAASGSLVYARILYKEQSGGFGDDVLDAPAANTVPESQIDAALIAVMDDLRRSLQWDGGLRLAETPVLDDVVRMIRRGEAIQGLRFLVLRNNGMYDLDSVDVNTFLMTDAGIGFSANGRTTYGPFKIQAGKIAPGDAIAACIGVQPTWEGLAAMESDTTLHALIPQKDETHRSSVTFVDCLTNCRSSEQLRDEYRDTSLWISPLVSVGG